MADDARPVAETVPFPSRRAEPPSAGADEAALAVAPEVRAVLALLRRISDPQLRRYCLEQIGAAESGEEVADALALVRALGEAPSSVAGRVAAGPRLVVGGVAPSATAGIGEGPGGAGRAILRSARKRKVRCIATSSSP